MKEKIEELKSDFSKGLAMFDPDPEIKNGYYTIYDKNDKIVGRSNRELALLRFRGNVASCGYEGAYVVFDGDETRYEITSDGKFSSGYNNAKYYKENPIYVDYCEFYLRQSLEREKENNKLKHLKS